MTPQELKNSILWNAIQGKITQQNSKENACDIVPFSVRSQVIESETYFDIPNNWCWCKIGDLFNLVNGKAFKPTDWSENGLPIVRIQNLNDTMAPYNYYDGEIEDKYILRGGELLFSWSGTPGTSFGAYIWQGGKAVLNQHIFIVYPRINLDCQYLRYALNGELKIFMDKAHGGAGLKHITKKEFESCFLPIPPLAEQKRIVAKIEELLPLIDRYETAWSRLETFNKRFPEDMQKSILQQAIQGKLVEQRPEEGTGEELYQQIQAEKQALIKAKKIKKDKPLPEIDEDEKPFDIPENWKWVRLSNISWFLDAGKSPKCEKVPVSGENWGVITTTSIQNGWFDDAQNKILPFGFEVNPSMQVKENDILITRAGPTNRTGVACVVNDIRYNLILSDKTLRINMTNQYADKDYIVRVLNSPPIRKLIIDLMSGMDKQQVNISQDKYRTLPIPLPPLAEQKRIVAKIEQLLPLCEHLKS